MRDKKNDVLYALEYLKDRLADQFKIIFFALFV